MASFLPGISTLLFQFLRTYQTPNEDRLLSRPRCPPSNPRTITKKISATFPSPSSRRACTHERKSAFVATTITVLVVVAESSAASISTLAFDAEAKSAVIAIA
jgi:hypothetical protein